MMEGDFGATLEKIMQAHVARERAWWRQDRRGRWVVLEPGPGRLLDDPRMGEIVDAVTDRRGRRFSSLARAQAFARQVDGVVRRWRRQMPGRGPWRHVTNPWEGASRRVSLPLLWRRCA